MMLKAYSQNRLRVRYVIGASVLSNLALAVSKNIVPFEFYGIFAESTIKSPSSNRPFCGLNISARVHPIELKISAKKHSTETYMSHQFELQRLIRYFPINVDIRGKKTFFVQLPPSISRDWRTIEISRFAQRDIPVPATDGMNLSPLEQSIDAHRTEQNPIFL